MKKNLFFMSIVTMWLMAQSSVGQNELFEIGTAEELEAFADYVSGDHQNVDACLTADIDYTGHSRVIGSVYNGTFDGQGHTITISLETERDEFGLFGNLGGDGVIKNLTIDGSIVSSAKNAGGFCGLSSGLISHCVSKVTITGTREGDSGHGGFVGMTYNSTPHFEFCISACKFVSDVTTHWGGYVGWNAWGDTNVEHCLEIVEAQIPTMDGCNPFVRGGYHGFSNYYVTQMGDGNGALQLTSDQLASGEACFMLNGDQSNIGWYQNLGEDPFPFPFSTHSQVYASGSYKCDGTTPLGVASYSNQEGAYTVANHTYDDGVCKECGYVDSEYSPQIDGVYQIEDAGHLFWFTKFVATGHRTASAVLTSDIDYRYYRNNIINDTYEGVFDGQGHTLTIVLNGDTDEMGFFRDLGGGGVIKNLTIDGTITSGGKNAGGFCGKTSGLISHCVSKVTITGTREGDSGHGGFAGLSYNDTPRFEFCLSACKFVSDVTTHWGGYVGWKSWGNTVVEHCMEIVDAEIPTTNGCCAFVRGGYNESDNYYMTNLGDNGSATLIDPEKISTGELCYILNGDQSQIGWFQTIGMDETPVPFANHGTVYLLGEKTFMDIHDDESFNQFKESLLSIEIDYATALVASTEIKIDYEDFLDEMSRLDDQQEFMEAYKSLQEKKILLQENAGSYTEYQQKVEEIKAFLAENSNLTGARRDQLESMLNETINPSLTTEEVNNAIAQLQQMLNDVIAFDYAAGTDITSMLENADFKAWFNGWQGKTGNGMETSSTTGLVGAECWSDTFDMYQTLDGLKNGVYMLTMSAAFRSHDTMESNNLIASIYAGENMVYMPSVYETWLPAAEAVDGVNCNLTGTNPDYTVTDEEGNVLGYAIHGCISIANAANANRSVCSIVTNVTDGNLTVGLKSPGSGCGIDWTGFSNIHLFYLGTMEEAIEKIDESLAGQIERARTLLNFQFSTGSDYSEYPNFSQELKNQLTAEIQEAESAETAESKYTVIQKFSKTFEDIYECKMAYINMLKVVEDAYAYAGENYPNEVTEEEHTLANKALEWAFLGYEEGSITTEEAQEMEILKGLSFYQFISCDEVEIESDADLARFVKFVNSGKTSLKARLTSDVSYTGTGRVINQQYNGVFDGQGHTLTIALEGNEDELAFFHDLGGNGVIKNLTIAGNITSGGKNAAGFCGVSSGLISHCVSLVTITGTREGDSGHGGFVGMTYNDTPRFEFCLSACKFVSDVTTHWGGYVGWKAWGTTAVESCMTIAEAEIPTTDGSNVFVRGGYNGNNCYFLTGSGVSDNGNASTVNAAQLANGEACYLLNGDQTNLNWFQTLGEDSYPVPFATHAVVTMNEDGTFANPTVISNIMAEKTKVRGTYNLMGQKTNTKQKGIYILNGKKVLVK